jgi:acetyl-CoA C-acetyltransferase
MSFDAYLYDHCRTPRGRGKPDGSLHAATPIWLVRTLLQALRERTRLDTALVDDVVLGCVTPVGEQGGDIARIAVLDAGWAQSVAGVTQSRFCASGLESVNLAAAKVASGFERLVVAGGVESMSRVAMGSDGGGMDGDNLTLRERIFQVPQGISADLIATLEGFSRDELDAWAARSHRLAAAARAEGRFRRALVPVQDEAGTLLLAEDETIRPQTTAETLAALNPSFAKLGAKFDPLALRNSPQVAAIEHRHHAGNSSGIVDGAALVLVGSRAGGEAAGLKPRARIRAAAVTGSEPTIMLTGTTPACEKALRQAGMRATDVDLWEINEAFAAVPLKTLRDLGLDPERVNVNGGAIALGHPLGATGAMLLGTLLDELEQRDLQTGAVTLCVGGGMGIATIIERV